jgi:L-aspartate oxidase
MWNFVGIVRSDLRLEMARKRIHTLFEETENFYKKTKVFEEILELRNVETCSHIIIKSAGMRKESRGLHYTLNYPEPDNSKKPVNTYIRNKHI